MRRWAWDLVCPKCGTNGMVPNWEGVSYSAYGQRRTFVQLGFHAECRVCYYQEEVLPLDEPTESALSAIRERFESKHTGPRV